MNAEQKRLLEAKNRQTNWKRWGCYLSERAWGTVREDYSSDGSAWDYFPFQHANKKAFRWNEDGIAGICDRKQRICFSLTLWNGKDEILKERLFGLAGPQGNHGEDVKELYYYLDAAPSHSYLKHLYKYPIQAYPYEWLVNENRNRTKDMGEFEIMDTGVFDNFQYFDITTVYVQANPDDLVICISVVNRSNAFASLHLLPTLWFRNIWTIGHVDTKPMIKLRSADSVSVSHQLAGDYILYFDPSDSTLFTENESNKEKLWNVPNESIYVKDAFHDAIVHHHEDRYTQKEGTKFAPVYKLDLDPGASKTIKLRLCKNEMKKPFSDVEAILKKRINECNEFYDAIQNNKLTTDQKNIQRQALAGMIWSKQFYYIDIPTWLNGDPGQVPPPASRLHGRNHHWMTLNNRDIISMPDKWEYPWYAAWDLAFHTVPISMIDPEFAKSQLVLLLREWYMHPNGQLPAYEWAFSDVNPPVHAWASIQVYKNEKNITGKGDIDFLKKVFQKLLINFTWWVNRKDRKGNNVFEGGFLGLDNIGIIDRSSPIPGGGYIEQADGTAWMAMYCLNMLEIALEIAQYDMSFEDVATKFFEHFVYIAESLNRIQKNWTGSWDEQDGFFYDILALPNGDYKPLKIRSLVGLSTLFATYKIPGSYLTRLKDFTMRLHWFKKYRIDNQQYIVLEENDSTGDILLSLVPQDRLKKLLHAMLDENEFLSSSGIRAISKIHEQGYYEEIGGQYFGLKYEPGESSTGLFGGNSNWRGPIWMPMNYLLIQSLREYQSYFGNQLQVECPANSGHIMSLDQVANDIAQRLISIFEWKDNSRKFFGECSLFKNDSSFKDLILFYEYFHGDNGRGVGASHQTGWTGLVASLIN